MSRSEDEDRLLDHDYDGIQEYDNPLPRWWVLIFWATIVFSVVYFLYFHVGLGATARDGSPSTTPTMAAHRGERSRRRARRRSPTRRSLGAASADARTIADGKAVFAKNCAACHGAGRRRR